MFEGVFTLRFLTSKNGFCYLSEQSSKNLDVGAAIKLRYGAHSTMYFSVQSSSSLKELELGLDRLHAEALGLEEGEHVVVSACSYMPGVRRLTVSPLTSDDYEVLELLAEGVESTLLNQIRVVSESQKFVIWISDHLHVTVNVDAVEPISPGRLDTLTEVAIARPSSRAKDPLEVKNEDNWLSLSTILNHFTKTATNMKDSSQDLDETLFGCHPSLGFILQPIEDLPFYDKEKFQHFDVFVCKEHLPNNFPKVDFSSDIFILKVILPPVINNHFVEENSATTKSIAVRLCVFEHKLEVERYGFSIMYVHNCIFKHFNLKTGAKVLLDQCIRTYPSISTIEICTVKAHADKTKDTFKQFLIGSCVNEKLVLNSEFILETLSGFVFFVKFLNSSFNYCVVTPNFIKTCKIVVNEAELILDNVKHPNKNDGINLSSGFGNLQQIIDESILVFTRSLACFGFNSENVLIVGKPGTGRTALTELIKNTLHCFPHYIHMECVSCKRIKGKSIDSLHKLFNSKIINLIYYQPSILILDDLHVICEKVNDGDALTPESLHFNRVSEMVAELLSSLRNQSKVAILATSESVFKLNEHIFASRGQHLFKNVFNISELGKSDRGFLLQHLFNQKYASDASVDFDELSVKMDGFVVQDIADFADKAIFEALKEEQPEVTMDHCEAALRNTTALSLKNVQLHTPGDRDFSDVGGLDNAKKVLIETVLWPVKYPNFFENAPLRIQSGLLLYGPPGTGKTVLAGAAAKQCGLRLISIKGPELLSKYIGASEEAVRGVFEKAQTAKPCILFFDEFDSLAPRRGHDNTGVTDRVVNQFLTQLDGVESLKGVCVIAATSRPDLLDPALLRPGRLDRQILCPLPDKDARFKILQSLSKRMNLADDVNLLEVAKKTESYSGADLQSVLYTAQLSAVEHLLEESEGPGAGGAAEITRAHLEGALRSTRPSLSAEERLKYEKIYWRFQRGSDAVDVKSGMQRATLA